MKHNGTYKAAQDFSYPRALDLRIDCNQDQDKLQQ